MHKQHEDQPSNELPDLSTWHRVPVGAVIPKGVPYAYAYDDRLTVELDGYPRDATVSRDDCTYYTEHPIAPPLPTEDWATILVTSQPGLPPNILLTREGGIWVNSYGAVWRVDQLTAWAPVTIGEVVIMP